MILTIYLKSRKSDPWGGELSNVTWLRSHNTGSEPSFDTFQTRILAIKQPSPPKKIMYNLAGSIYTKDNKIDISK